MDKDFIETKNSKEKITEENTKAYNVALEKAKKIIKKCQEIKIIDPEFYINELKEIFPELKENNNDKRYWEILKSIIHDNVSDYVFRCFNIEKEKFEDWLEQIREECSNLSNSFVWIKNDDINKPQQKRSVLLLTKHGVVAEGEFLGKNWMQYRWSCTLKDSDVLYWMPLSFLFDKRKKEPNIDELKEVQNVVSEEQGYCCKDADCGDYEGEYCDDNYKLRDEEERLKSLEYLVKKEWSKAEAENNSSQISKMSDLLFFLKTIKLQPS